MGNGAPASLPPWLSRPGRRLRSMVRARVAIDARALAVFRVVAGLLVIADLLLRARNFAFFYTESGVVPRSLAMEAGTGTAYSVYHLTTSSTVIAGLFVLQGLIALQLIVGYRTRLATVLTFVGVISLDAHNPFVLSYADVLFRLLLLWAIFLPLGERWSIDAVHRARSPRAAVASVASALLLGQMVWMYVRNGLHKRESPMWTEGTATPLIMGLDNTTFLLGDLVRELPALLQLGGLTWYYMMLGGWLLLVLRGWPRIALVGLFVGAHASFALTVRIGAFPYVAIMGLVPFLQAPFWDALDRLADRIAAATGSARGWRGRRRTLETRGRELARRAPSPRLDAAPIETLRSAAYVVALAAIVLSMLALPTLSYATATAGIGGEPAEPEPIERVADNLSVEQPDWSVFAPTPRTTDRYYVFPARTADGELIDAYNDRPLSYERPADELQTQFGTYRERFYMNSVRRGSVGGQVTERLADHLCETYPDEHGVELTHVNMYYVAEDVTMETIDDPSERDRDAYRIGTFACGDAEPTELQPPPF